MVFRRDILRRIHDSYEVHDRAIPSQAISKANTHLDYTSSSRSDRSLRFRIPISHYISVPSD